MSNAEQERIEKAWEEAEIPIDCVLGDNKWAVMKNGFRYGFLAGQADALVLPEVRAEELEEGKYYLGLHKHEGWHVCWKNSAEEIVEGMIFYRHGQSPSFTSFRGPLPLGGGE